jgi:probable F420-dependent oxidoreductase
MQLGAVVRTMGPASSRETVLACARAGEAAGLDDLFVVDHVAIPPDDAEGSGGRYLDPLATLGVLAGATERIGLGTAVLILPYRPALPTAKQIATLQELSGGRLRLGVGIGWMEAEFRALGVDRARRGAIADETLAFLRRCFDGAGPDDVVEANGQPFLFRPRPKAPPIYVGGAGPHALARAVRFGDGWMPMAASVEKLREPVAALQRLAAEAGRKPLEVAAMGRLPLDDAPRARDDLVSLAALGVTRFVHADRYEDVHGFARSAEELVALR